MRRSTTTALGLAAATCLLTACGSGAAETGDTPASDSPSSSRPSSNATSSTGTTTTSPTPSATADVKPPEFPSDTGQQFARNKGDWDLVLRDVRVAKHDGFDRMVVEFKGAVTPGWGVEYVKTPRADGSGEVVHVNGDSYLGVNISGMIIRQSYPETKPDYFRGPRHFAPEDGGVVVDVNIGGVFEGYSQVFLGVDGDNAPFRVFALTNPSRLVVDLKAD